MTQENQANGFDEAAPIAQAWARQDETNRAALLSLDPATLVASTARAHLKDQLRLVWLNFQEVIPALFVAVVFGMQAPDAERPIAVVAAVLLVLGVGAYLLIGSIRHHRADQQWGSSIRSQLNRRLTQVEHRARLYRSVLWWYITPLTAAVFLVNYGIGGDQAPVLWLAAFMGALGVGVYALNRWYGRTRYEVEVVRLQEILDDFEAAPS